MANENGDTGEPDAYTAESNDSVEGGSGEDTTAYTLSGTCGDPTVNNGENVTWALTANNDGTYTLTISGAGAMKDFGPSQLSDGTWSSDAPWYSVLTVDSKTKRYPVTALVIGDGITHIGGAAFASLAIPEISFKQNVTSYGAYAYIACTAATTVDWTNFSLDTIPEGLLYGCTALRTFKNGGTDSADYALMLPDTVTGIGTSAFFGCTSLIHADLTNLSKSIGQNAFMGCTDLKQVDLPKTVEESCVGSYFGIGCFSSTALGTITLPDNVTAISDNMFNRCGLLTDVKTTSSIKTIGKTAFFCDQDSVGKTSAPWSSFVGTNLDLSGVTTIGESAFNSCSSLKSVIHLDSIQSLGDRAFGDCSSVQAIDMSKAGDSITFASNAFTLLGNNSVIYVASNLDSLTDLYEGIYSNEKTALAITNGGTFSDETVFTAGTLAEPTKLDSLFKGWFDKSGNEVTDENPAEAGNTYYAKWDDAQLSGNCGTVDSSGNFGSKAKWSLTPNGNGYTLTIYGSGEMADFSCNITNSNATQPWRESLSGVKNTDITKVVVIGVSNIGAFAFNGLSAVASYDIGSAVTTIGRWGIDTEGTETFELNGNTNFTLVDGVLMTADKATLIAYPGGADAVAEYVIPSTVTNVVGGAFVGCDAQKVVIPENVTDFSAWSFAGSSIEEIVFNANMQEIGAGMFAGLRELKTLDFGQYVTRIGTQSSYNLINLKNLVIPANVTSIGGQAFKYLGDEEGGTEKVTFEGNMPNMDDQVFLRQNRLTTVDLSKSTTFGTISWNFFGTESVAAYYFDTQEHAEMLTRKSINKTKAIFAVLNGGNIPADKGYYADCHDDAGSLVLVTPEKEGYTFEGWYDNADCTGTSVSDETVLQAGTVYYAKWVPNPYTVTFVANGGEASTNTMPVTYASAYGELPTATRTGFKFDGWFTAAEGGDKVESSTVCTTAANHTLYAHWLEKKTPELTISAMPDTLRGGGKVELTVTASAGAGKITVTYKSASSEDVITLTPNADGKYTVTLPNRTETYTFTVDCAESAEFTHKTASCPVSVTRRTSSAANSGNTVSVPSTPNGTVTVTPSTATKDTTVTIITKPNEGYELGDLTVKDANGNTLPLTDKGDGKYTFTMPGSKVVVEASFVKAASTGFVDVPADAYFADAVKWAVDNGVTNGLSDTTFGPYESCTRAQIVTFLWRAAGSPEPTASEMTFTDVKADSYYDKAVLWAVENKITSGMSDTLFAPDATCSRSQIVTFLYRMQNSPESKAENPFTDVKADAYYANAVLWAVENGVTTGASATTFDPAGDCMRGQIVTFLYRCLSK